MARKDINDEPGGRARVLMDRTSPLYHAVYNRTFWQRATSAYIEGPNPLTWDGIYHFLQVACEAGYMLGMRSGYACYGYDIQFVDSEYQHPNFERHLRTIMKHRPKYAVVPDLSDKKVSIADIERALSQYEQISPYCQIPLIVPKLTGQIALLPSDVAIGYSVWSSYGGARYDLYELAGRRVHLLGRSPSDQMEVFRQLAGRAEVMSADGNMAMGAARNWAQYWNGGWVDYPEKGTPGLSLYLNCWRKSCENIRCEWEGLVMLQPRQLTLL